MAKALKSLCYQVCVFADADADDQFSNADADDLERLGVPVFIWADKLSLEERVFQDLPWPSVLDSLKLAQNELGFTVHVHVSSKVMEDLNRDMGKWQDSVSLRAAIGMAAKKYGWFKDITRGDKWFSTLSPIFASPDFSKKDTAIKLDKLWTWAANV